MVKLLEIAASSAREINTAAEANMVTHMSWVQRQEAGMLVDDREDLIVIDSGLPCDTFNFICRARLAEATAKDRIAEAIAHFETAGRPFSWWVGPADEPADLGRHLLAVGLEDAESEVAMAADLDTLSETDLEPHGLRIERVRTAEQLHVFAEINAANWSPPDPEVLRFYGTATDVLLAADCPIRFYLGFLGPEPVATSELTVGGGVVGLYSICTRENHRRKGIGSAMTARPLVDARSEGFKTGILQAAADGLGVYRRLGFAATGHFTEYQPVG